MGQFLTKSSKSPIIAHRHLCLDMFEGEGLKIWFKNVFDKMFLKHLTSNVV